MHVLYGASQDVCVSMLFSFKQNETGGCEWVRG